MLNDSLKDQVDGHIGRHVQRGKTWRKRRSTTTRNKWDGMVVSLFVGVSEGRASSRPAWGEVRANNSSQNSPSGEFQEVESNYSGRWSFFFSQFAIIPSSRSMLSRDKRAPLDTWNTSGLQENVFGNQFSTFDSSRDHRQGIHSCATQRERGSVPQATATGTLFTN